jgi:hypothetical protein
MPSNVVKDQNRRNHMNCFTRVFSRTSATLIALAFISLTALVSGCSQVAKTALVSGRSQIARSARKNLRAKEIVTDIYGHRIPQDYIKRNGVVIIILKDKIPPRHLLCSENVCTLLSKFKQAFDIHKSSLTGPQRQVVDEYFKVHELVSSGELHRSELQEVAKRLGKDHKTVREHFDRALAKISGIPYEQICEMRRGQL